MAGDARHRLDWLAVRAEALAAEAEPPAVVAGAARSARHPRRFPAADLARLLTIHADKGIEGVKAEFSVSERQAYRLLDRARKEIP